MKLNIGCGTDYRDGFINIDGSHALAKVDKIVEIGTDSLLSYFKQGSVSYILANDIVEHLFHWEAIKLLQEFYKLLSSDGRAEIRVPDALYIIENRDFSIERKLNLLFGGQDIPQGIDAKMDESRKHFPQYFCHKFGWTMDSISRELRNIGFRSVECERSGTNLIAHARL